MIGARARRALYVFCLWLPLWAVPLAFVAVLRSGATPAPLARSKLPDEGYRTDRCTWACHNRGCRHEPKLPLALTADEGLFGWAIGALYRFGELLVPSHQAYGYGAANLLVFCAAWPAVMWALWWRLLRHAWGIRS